MKTKLFTAMLALTMTGCLIASVRATAQQTLNDIDAHIIWSLNDHGVPIQDCNLGHPLCCNATIPVDRGLGSVGKQSAWLNPVSVTKL